MERRALVMEEGVVKEKRIHPPIDPGDGAGLRYTVDERLDTDKNRCRKKYGWKVKSNREARGEADEDHDGKLDRKNGRRPRCNT